MTTPRLTNEDGDGEAGWHVFTATSIGASHRAAGLPCQDAAAVQPPSALGQQQAPFVVAIADGHGNPAHFRSDRGARFAVEVACQVALGAAASVQTASGADAIVALGRTQIAPAIIDGWRSRVGDDLRRDPTSAEQPADDTVAYGTTLVVALVVGRRWVLIGQIGDGDVVATGPEGRTWAPIPADLEIVGDRTTSLCQLDPLRSFRLAVVDRAESPLLALALVTDGFGNSQEQDPWQPAFGADLAHLVQERGPDWVGRAVPSWAERCASGEGSGDDVTLALLLASPARVR